jgi:S-DNA-T family DNA segregation ATPase FtsK/SpoIIIE
MQRSVTVSELKFACLDPEWRRKFLEGKKPSTRNITPPGEIPLYGALFPRIIHSFIGWLTKSRSKKVQAIDDSQILWQELHDRFAAKELEAIAGKGALESSYHLALALKAFCKRVVEIRNNFNHFKNWQDLYLAKEYSVKNVKFELGSSKIFVSGQLDAVRFHPDKDVEVVDYKLTHGRNMKRDLLQLAIYAKLLALAKPGLRFQGSLEYYEPELKTTEVSKEDLEVLFEDKVMPILYEIAGVKPPQLQPIDQGLVAAQNGDEDLEETEDHSEAIKNCFASFKLDVEVLSRREAPQLLRYRVKPAPGVKVISLANRAEDLRVALSLLQTPVVEPSTGSVVIDIPKDKPDTVYWHDVIKEPVYKKNKSPVAFPVGMGVDGRLIISDFADPNMCHCLVAGVAGSGKSEFLKSMVASLIQRNPPERVCLTIIDPKILTFGGVPDDLSHLTGPVLNEIGDAIPCLQRAVEDMEFRYQTLADAGQENLTARFQSGQKDIPFHVVVFDEFADLIMAGKEEKKEFERLVGRLAQMGRAAGIHLTLTTQRPDRTVVTGLIKANLPLKICMRVTNSSNSSIVLDQTGGEKLLGRGDLLCDRGRGPQRAQSPYVTQENFRDILKNAPRKDKYGKKG